MTDQILSMCERLSAKEAEVLVAQENLDRINEEIAEVEAAIREWEQWQVDAARSEAA